MFMRRLGCLFFASLMLCASCYLTSPQPTGRISLISERDLQVSKQINDVLAESGQIIRDMNSLASYSLGEVPSYGPNYRTLADLPEYTSIFDPIEGGSLKWKAESPDRFSREILNEAVYLIKRKNQVFRMRAEGRVIPNASGLPKLEALVLALDSEKEISASGSEAVLSARQRCKESDCKLVLRIDHNAISKIVQANSASKPDQPQALGTIVATSDSELTTATIENIAFGALKLVEVKYTRSRKNGTSIVDAKCVVEVPGSGLSSFTVQGDLRNPGTLIVSRIDPTNEVKK